jgi:hypothetical protein
MELQQNLDLIFDVDAVLRGQGADAPLLHARRPALVKMVGQALQLPHDPAKISDDGVGH